MSRMLLGRPAAHYCSYLKESLTGSVRIVLPSRMIVVGFQMTPAPVPRLLLLTIALAASSLGFARDIKVGEQAPDFYATTFDGRKISLADYKGRVLIINLWATWCIPCREELPLLDAYYWDGPRSVSGMRSSPP